MHSLTFKLFSAAARLPLSLEELSDWACTRQSSPEIAVAIFELAGYHAATAERVCASPTDDQEFQVVQRAYELAPSEARFLNWGKRTYRRLRKSAADPAPQFVSVEG